MSNQNKIKRTSTKSSLTRFTKYFQTIKDDDDIDLLDLQQRLTKAETLFEDFHNAQLAIESEDPDFEINYDTVHSPVREQFENEFYKITSAVKKFIMLHETHEHTSIHGNDSNYPNNTTIHTNIRLPQLNLPTFDGSLDQWLFFRDSFKSIIHDNSIMTNAQKFHYLRLSVQGTAADKIKSLQIYETNYNIAWKLLCDRFEDKQSLIKNHIKSLFQLPTPTKESHEGLNFILDSVEKNLNALNVLERPTDHWDDLLVFLITTKFDHITHHAMILLKYAP
ncbi:uncharacterized protein LOC130453180 [Diorhabda sublineata]|uniref:uncharacterized protein LOC130453180 n=1 Tax=Diorhabda sublineata TaxID=1163346 RepID=UPI0024E09B15|nr:uncharacterized protein LOC130453180 [Diorhabda sublineata]